MTAEKVLRLRKKILRPFYYRWRYLHYKKQASRWTKYLCEHWLEDPYFAKSAVCSERMITRNLRKADWYHRKIKGLEAEEKVFELELTKDRFFQLYYLMKWREVNVKFLNIYVFYLEDIFKCVIPLEWIEELKEKEGLK